VTKNKELVPTDLLPKKVRILHSWYDVDVTNHKYLKQMDRLGELNFTDKVISIAEQKPSELVDTFVHEVLHGIIHHMDVLNEEQKEELEEHLVLTMATGLTTFMMDNPFVFPQLQEILKMSKKDIDMPN
jgi:hypothetical protein